MNPHEQNPNETPAEPIPVPDETPGHGLPIVMLQRPEPTLQEVGHFGGPSGASGSQLPLKASGPIPQSKLTYKMLVSREPNALAEMVSAELGDPLFGFQPLGGPIMLPDGRIAQALLGTTIVRNAK